MAASAMRGLQQPLEFAVEVVCVRRPADVRAVRDKLGASQPFALLIGVSVATLPNWEQGRRTPDGPALALLRVAVQNPKAVVAALHGVGKRGAA